MTGGDPERAREAFDRRAWGEAYAHLAGTDDGASLGLDDLERLAVAAYLVGRDDESVAAWTRAHLACMAAGDVPRAARCAFWLAFWRLLRGDQAQATGWLGRARRVLDDAAADDCVERGYLLVPDALQHQAAGESATAHDLSEQVIAIAERFGDPDLTAFGRLGRGQALIALGRVREGVALLDEVMVAVIADELSPPVAGLVYCAVIEACHDTFDVRRAHEWTVALTRWCESQPDLVPYRGSCLVHRCEIMRLQGAWPDAMDTARQASTLLGREPAAGDAFYQQAELHRLRGELDAAEAAYRRASGWGRRPQPGLALLRLAQGREDAAQAMIRRALDEAHDRVARSKVLAACVEIELAAGDVAAARTVADELAALAAERDAPLLAAMADEAAGTVLLAEGDAHAAAGVLRRAWAAFRDLGAPYEAARVRLQLGLAYRGLGDGDTADMELDAARRVFEELGAEIDRRRVDVLARPAPPAPVDGLTAREVEVLVLVARGKTNRAIADELFISEKTVARHLSNIFTKLSVSSRAAATAYAYERRLVSPAG